MEELTELQKSCLALKESPVVNGIKWKDCTTYSQGEKLRIPKAFETEIGDIRIAIVYGHIYHKGKWIFHCYTLGYDTKLLEKAATAKEAAEMAFGMCRDKAEKMYNAFLPEGIRTGDKVKIIGNKYEWHNFEINSIVEVIENRDNTCVCFNGDHTQIIFKENLEKINK